MMSESVKNTQQTRRSLIYRWHDERGACYTTFAGQRIVANYLGIESGTTSSLGLCDYSTLPRFGVKGREALTWINSRFSNVPQRANLACQQDNGEVLARLSEQEFLYLGALPSRSYSQATAPVEWLDSDEPGIYTLPRADSHCCFALYGGEAATMFATLCAVDLSSRAFANGDIAQTSLARISAVIIRSDEAQQARFLVLADSASAQYLWDCLIEAIADFDGHAIGIDRLINEEG